MHELSEALDREAGRTSFSGVVRVDRDGAPAVVAAYGLADRAHAIPMTAAHQLGTASVTKGFTALVVLGLVSDGALQLGTTARSVLGADLPLIDDEVTVEHLLTHRSGIGDYLDEDELEDSSDYVLPVPVHTLVTTEDYLSVLGGHPMASAPGETFAYNNGAFVVLALIAERVAQTPYHELVGRRVLDPAGLSSTAFLRSDELPGSAALGYLHADGLRTNVLHLPVRGTGDGGAYTTVADMSAFWPALLGGRILPERWVSAMTTPTTADALDGLGYGLGMWVHPNGTLELHGYDAGVSFRSMHHAPTASTWTVASNTSEGTWPLEAILEADLPA